MKHIAVIGGGSFGSAMAYRLGKHHTVKVYARNQRFVDSVNKDASCITYPVKFSPTVSATSSIQEAVHNARTIIYAVPVKSSLSFLSEHADLITRSTCPIISCSKGVVSQVDSGFMTMQKVFATYGVDELRYASIAGPAFARSMFDDEPLMMSLASQSTMGHLDDLWRGSFTVQSTTDVIGQEICGAMKNVVAIAAGAASTVGPSAQAAIVGVMWNDMGEIIASMGGNPLTISQPAMLGDLIATCSPESRNFRFGVSCARELVDVRRLGETIEGYYSLMALIHDKKIRTAISGRVIHRMDVLNAFVDREIGIRSMIEGILD